MNLVQVFLTPLFFQDDFSHPTSTTLRVFLVVELNPPPPPHPPPPTTLNSPSPSQRPLFRQRGMVWLFVVDLKSGFHSHRSLGPLSITSHEPHSLRFQIFSPKLKVFLGSRTSRLLAGAKEAPLLHESSMISFHLVGVFFLPRG